jgi:hypothetical protein
VNGHSQDKQARLKCANTGSDSGKLAIKGFASVKQPKLSQAVRSVTSLKTAL